MCFIFSCVTCVICTATTSVSAEHRSKNINVDIKKRSGPGWYAQLSEVKKAEHLQKLWMARQQKKSTDLSVNVNVPRYSALQVSYGVSQLDSAQPGVSQILCTPCSGSAVEEDCGSDWLHTNPTYQRQMRDVRDVFDKSLTEAMHGQESFLPGSISSRSVQMKDASLEKNTASYERTICRNGGRR